MFKIVECQTVVGIGVIYWQLLLRVYCVFINTGIHDVAIIYFHVAKVIIDLLVTLILCLFKNMSV